MCISRNNSLSVLVSSSICFTKYSAAITSDATVSLKIRAVVKGFNMYRVFANESELFVPRKIILQKV